MKEKPTLPPVEDLVKDVLQEIRGRKKSTKQKGIDK